MTSEREEVIDFVAPYFEQSGILIGKTRVYLYHNFYTIYRNIPYTMQSPFHPSDKEACSQSVPLQIHDSTRSGSMAEHRRSINVNWHHDLDT